MKVWIVFKDYGYEGKSELLAVFDSQEKADLIMRGASMSDGFITVKEMDVE